MDREKIVEAMANAMFQQRHASSPEKARAALSAIEALGLEIVEKERKP